MLDTNDRFLRKITVGQGPLEKGHTREVGHVMKFVSLRYIELYCFGVKKSVCITIDLPTIVFV